MGPGSSCPDEEARMVQSLERGDTKAAEGGDHGACRVTSLLHNGCNESTNGG